MNNNEVNTNLYCHKRNTDISAREYRKRVLEQYDLSKLIEVAKNYNFTLTDKNISKKERIDRLIHIILLKENLPHDTENIVNKKNNINNDHCAISCRSPDNKNNKKCCTYEKAHCVRVPDDNINECINHIKNNKKEAIYYVSNIEKNSKENCQSQNDVNQIDRELPKGFRIPAREALDDYMSAPENPFDPTPLSIINVSPMDASISNSGSQEEIDIHENRNILPDQLKSDSGLICSKIDELKFKKDIVHAKYSNCRIK